MADELSVTKPPQPQGLRLVVIMPALNEEITVGKVIEGIPLDIAGVRDVRVVVVDDGSTDRTGEIATSLGAQIVRHVRPQGVGAAYQSGLRKAMEMGADVVVNIDADGQFNPADIPKLVEPVVTGKADFVTASRFKDPTLTPKMPWVKAWGNRQMSRLISMLTGQKFYDVSCGMRACSRRAALSLSLIGSFTYTQEAFLNLAFKQLQIVEVPIEVRGEREHGKSRVASSIRKYAVNTSKIIFRCYRDYYPMRFFGRIAAVLIVLGMGFGAFLLGHYVLTGSFSPHKWAGFTGAALVFLGLGSFHIGLVGDMLNRQRIYLEEVLYHVRDVRSRLLKDDE